MSKPQGAVSETYLRPATYQFVLDAPPHKVAQVQGIGVSLYIFGRSAYPCIAAGPKFGRYIGKPFEYDDSGPGSWLILDERRIQPGKDILAPDTAGRCRERMPGPLGAACATLAPDWSCEVVSPLRASWIWAKKARCAPERMSVTCGWLTRSAVHWTQGSWSARIALRLPRCNAMRQFRNHRLRASVSVLAICGGSDCSQSTPDETTVETEPAPIELSR